LTGQHEDQRPGRGPLISGAGTEAGWRWCCSQIVARARACPISATGNGTKKAASPLLEVQHFSASVCRSPLVPLARGIQAFFVSHRSRVYRRLNGYYFEPARTTQLLRLNGISIELCFVSQHEHRCIDVARISVADAALLVQVHLFAASRIFLAEYLGIDRRLPVRRRLVISLENRTFAEAVIDRELDAVGKGRQCS
jgi:hypothetical protein